MKLTFLGATKEVTGSCYLLEINNIKILVDCGMWQGQKFTEDRNYKPFPFNPKEINYLILTHAHLDHCGRIPKLFKDGFNGKIITTHATAEFAQLMLKDSAHVIKEEAEIGGYPPLYAEADAEACNPLFQGYNYHEKIKLANDIEVCLFDAGHILGSAIVTIMAEGKKIVFSGDLGNPPVPILKNTEFISSADYVIMESTYGGIMHEDFREKVLKLSSAIYETATLKGTLMIPAFALERTQELLYELNKLIENKNVPPLPVFLDSPLGIEATMIFKQYKNLYNQETLARINKGDDIFSFPGLQQTRTSMESKMINDTPGPKIVIAGSGMCQGGRIRFHLERYLPDFKSQLLIIGYQVAGSLGRQLLEKKDKIYLHGKQINVKAKVKAIGAYSAHADQPKLLNWVSHFTNFPKTIFITHGEIMQSQALAEDIENNLRLKTCIPEEGYSITI